MANALDAAVGNEHRDVVRFLLENGFTEITIQAINTATWQSCGDDQLVLDDRLVDGAFTTATQNATSHGHFDFIRWFYRNHREALTKEAIGAAVWRGHLNIVRFLYDRCGLVHSENTSCYAREKEFSLIEWAMKNHSVLRAAQVYFFSFEIPSNQFLSCPD